MSCLDSLWFLIYCDNTVVVWHQTLLVRVWHILTFWLLGAGLVTYNTVGNSPIFYKYALRWRWQFSNLPFKTFFLKATRRVTKCPPDEQQTSTFRQVINIIRTWSNTHHNNVNLVPVKQQAINILITAVSSEEFESLVSGLDTHQHRSSFNEFFVSSRKCFVICKISDSTSQCKTTVFNNSRSWTDTTQFTVRKS